MAHAIEPKNFYVICSLRYLMSVTRMDRVLAFGMVQVLFVASAFGLRSVDLLPYDPRRASIFVVGCALAAQVLVLSTSQVKWAGLFDHLIVFRDESFDRLNRSTTFENLDSWCFGRATFVRMTEVGASGPGALVLVCKDSEAPRVAIVAGLESSFSTGHFRGRFTSDGESFEADLLVPSDFHSSSSEVRIGRTRIEPNGSGVSAGS